MRWILIALACWVAWMIFRRLYLQPRAEQQKDTEKEKTPEVREGGRFVRCDHCSLHVPEQEAIRDGTHRFCSEAHRQSGPAA